MASCYSSASWQVDTDQDTCRLVLQLRNCTCVCQSSRVAHLMRRQVTAQTPDTLDQPWTVIAALASADTYAFQQYRGTDGRCACLDSNTLKTPEPRHTCILTRVIIAIQGSDCTPVHQPNADCSHAFASKCLQGPASSALGITQKTFKSLQLDAQRRSQLMRSAGREQIFLSVFSVTNAGHKYCVHQCESSSSKVSMVGGAFIAASASSSAALYLAWRSARVCLRCCSSATASWT